MAEPMRTTRRINLENLDSLEFTKSRKGYDADEVRGALATIARQVRAMIDERERLTDQLKRSEEKVEDLLARPTPVPDRHELTRMLGDEMVRLLDSAKETADEIVAAAQAERDEIESIARAEADRLRLEAEEAISARRVEAAETERQILERAEAFMAQREEEARLANEANQEKIDAEYDAARQAAKEQLDAAREEGRSMIIEARQFRETILRDLAGRRKIARKQLEAMRAAQERLLEAFTSCAIAVEGATSELHTALPAAKAAADLAADRVNDDIEQVVNELEQAIHTGELPALVLGGLERPKIRSNALPRTEADDTDGVRPIDDEPSVGGADQIDSAISGYGESRHESATHIDRDVADDEWSSELNDAASSEARSEPFEDRPAASDTDIDASATAETYGASDLIDAEDDIEEIQPGPARQRFGVIDGEGGDADEDADIADEDDFEDSDYGDYFDDDEELDDDTPDNKRPALRLLATAQVDADPADASDGDASANEIDGLDDDEADDVEADDLVDVGSPSAGAVADAASDETAAMDDSIFDGSESDADPDDDTWSDDIVSDSSGAAEAAESEIATPIEPGREDESADDCIAQGDEAGGESHGVDGLFARLRADRDAAVTAAREVLDHAMDDISVERPVDADALIEQRDEWVGSVERNVARRFKRVLDDEQNEVLDRIRRSKVLNAASVLPNEDAMSEAYLDVGAEELLHAVSSGAASLREMGVRSRPIDPQTIVDQLGPVIGAQLISPWLDELAALIEEANGDRTAAVNAVRTAYRYRKMDHLAELSGAVVVAAYNAGVVAAARRDDVLEWVTAHIDVESAEPHFASVSGNDVGRSISIFIEGSMGTECRCLLVPVDRN